MVGRDGKPLTDPKRVAEGLLLPIGGYKGYGLAPLLVQAMLDAPMFGARWRWVAGTSLALPRFVGGKKVPAPLQRTLDELAARLGIEKLRIGA